MDYRKSLSYNRNAAVNYAMKYAVTPNPSFRYFLVYGDNGGNCTNFTSQCLNAGGAPMVFSSKNPWWYKNKNTPNPLDDSWSFSWTVVGSLYWYLKTNNSKKLYGVKGEEVSSVSMLEIGDMIFYQNPKGMMAHSAIITSFRNNYPLISQHTPNALNIPYIKSWAVKMHFLKISL